MGAVAVRKTRGTQALAEPKKGGTEAVADGGLSPMGADAPIGRVPGCSSANRPSVRSTTCSIVRMRAVARPC